MLEMYKIDKSIDERIKKYLNANKKNELWNFGNNILYKMCELNLGHTQHEIVAGKLWIIGRSYAAALERRRKHNDISSEEFFAEHVIPTMIDNAYEIDAFLKNAKNCDYTIDENLNKIIEIHKYLTDIFQELTGLNKRSLASKYLHFHCPNLFFIYDSRAHSNLSKYVKKKRRKNEIFHGATSYDKEYLEFYYRALKLLRYTQNKYDETFTPRDIDNVLVFTKD